MATPLRILILEDRPADAELMLHELRRAGFDPAWERVETEVDYLARLDPGLDVILADYGLPQFDALRALQLLRERGLDIPFLVVTGTLGDEAAVECIKQGAADYLLKDRLARLGQAVKQALEEKGLREEKRRAEAALVVRTRQLEAVRAVITEITRELDLTTLLKLIVRRAAELVEAESGTIFLWDEGAQVLIPQAWQGLGDWIGDVHLRLGEAVAGTVAQRRAGMIVNDYRNSPYAYPVTLDRTGICAILAEPLLYRERLVGVITINHEKSTRAFTAQDRETLALFADQAAIAIENARLYQELKRSYEDLQRSQVLLLRQEKLAALGRLASGVAHELNNPLAAIVGFAEVLQEKLKRADLAAEPTLADFPRQLRQIADQGARCGDLVRRLLTYARQREPQRKPVDLWQVVEDSLALMAAKVRMLGGRFEAVRTAGPHHVLADPNMLQQVAINLLTNALDAVEGEGTVRLAVYRDEAAPGQAAIVLEVADTGTGITPNALPHLFDPFFTTKGPDRGTGLGLPISLSIVEQHGGTLEIRSPGPGLGATATVRLPAAAEESRN